MSAPYTCEILADGTHRVWNSEKEEIPVDMGSQDYADFLTWNASKYSPHYPEIKTTHQTHYFTNLSKLLEHLQRSSNMVYVSYGPDSSGVGINCERDGFAYQGQQPFLRLPLAFNRYMNTGGAPESHDGLWKGDGNIAITTELRTKVMDDLISDDGPARKYLSFPINRCFVYLDVSDFSKFTPGQQSMVIKSIINTVDHQILWTLPAATECRKAIIAQICIGDGYIYVFRNPRAAGFFAAYLANLIELLVASRLIQVEFHFRMGVHSGPVYQFLDPGRNDLNYVGDGINGGQRVLSAVGKDMDDVLFISAQLRSAILSSHQSQSNLPSILTHAHNRGRKSDKHGNPWRVYEINHSALMEPFDKEIRQLIGKVRSESMFL